MNEKYVTGLTLSQKLKDAGVKQKSEWYWCTAGKEPWLMPCPEEGMSEKRLGDHHRPEDVLQNKTEHYFVYYAAFHVGELGEMLPKWIYTTKDSNKNDDFYCWCDGENNAPEDLWEGIEPIHANTEAEARGLMLLYLIEHELLSVSHSPKERRYETVYR